MTLDHNLAHVTTWGTCDKPLKNHEVLTWASKDVDITSIKPFILSSNFGCLWIASGLPGVCQATKLKRPCAVKIDGSTSQKTIGRNNSNGEWMSNLQWKQAAGCGKTCSGSCLRQPTARHSLIAVVAVMNGTTFLLRTEWHPQHAGWPFLCANTRTHHKSNINTSIWFNM